MYSKQSHSAIRTTLDLKRTNTNTYVTVTGVNSRITVTLSYLKQKKRKKRTITNTFLVVQNMFSVLERMDMGMIVLTIHDWKKTNAVIG